MSEQIACLHYPAPKGDAEILLVMLPGAGIKGAEFAEQGMVAALRAHGLSVDVTVAHPDIELYLEDGVTEVLHRAVVEPALARGIKRIWLLGISLGGMGALLYASAHQQHVEGIVLLAPFLGTKGTIAELDRAGGLAAWSAANSGATEPEKRLLRWLQARLASPASDPALYLGYAAQDRFAPAHKMLAACLPPACVAIVPGGHDWPSWSALWRALLDKYLFTAPAGRCHEQ
jgi:pimeloyl-ACP methyl ester carboxylesterase